VKSRMASIAAMIENIPSSLPSQSDFRRQSLNLANRNHHGGFSGREGSEE
jgi:hypothetical protein